MAGTLALVGAGEFLETMEHVDRELLARAGGTRVVILPTASAPDGPGVPERWARMGVDHFTRLGAQVEGLLALDHAACDDPANADRVRAANLVYFSGGKPDYLRRTLQGTALWDAVTEVLERGGVVAGCSAGAMIMGAYVPDFSSVLGVPSVRKWEPSFSLIPHAIVVPHYNEFPEMLGGLMFRNRPEGTFVLGIDGHTALVGAGKDWQVRGQNHVTIRNGSEARRYADPQEVVLDAS